MTASTTPTFAHTSFATPALTAAYMAKRCTAEEAVRRIARRARVCMGMAAAMPVALTDALADAARDGAYDLLKLYYMHPTGSAARSVLSADVLDVIRPHPFWIGSIERGHLDKRTAGGQPRIAFIPGSFSQNAAAMLDNVGIDVHLVTVSKMDQHGYFSFGTNGDYSVDVARKAKHVIVEVNPHMPRTFGGGLLHISEVDALVERDAPLTTFPPRAIRPIERQIAGHIVPLVPDAACLQVGVGGLGTAVLDALGDKNDLGIHSELLSGAMVDLIAAGNVTNTQKRVAPHMSVYTLAMGEKPLYDFMHNNPSMGVFPASFVNDPRVIAKNDNVVSVNAMIEVDLTGQVNAECMAGKQFSAPGGQLDFVRGAFMSKGGKSIIAAPSTACKGTVSRIVPALSGPATDTRMDVHHIATEFGVVNLRGKSLSERATLLIGIAHPDFRELLTQSAKDAGVL